MRTALLVITLAACAEEPAGPIVQISGHVIAADPPGPRLAGGAICVLDHSELPCATIAEDGGYTLGVVRDPPEGRFALLTQITGYADQVSLGTKTRLGFFDGNQALSADFAIAALFSETAGFHYPDDGGYLELQVLRPDTSVSIAQPAIGPIYFGDDAKIDLQRTATSLDGRILFGGIAPGLVDITIDPGCQVVTQLTPGFAGWAPRSPESTMLAEVASGAVTKIAFECE